jgi:DNA-binding MarR family transcriptional regulator
MSSEGQESDIQRITSLDTVIHAPGRLAILSVLEGVDSLEFSELQRQTGLTRGNLSAHLLKLEAAHYISVTKSFVDRIPCTVLALTDSGRTEFSSYRTQLRNFLGESSDEGSLIFQRYRRRMRQALAQPPPKKS